MEKDVKPVNDAPKEEVVQEAPVETVQEKPVANPRSTYKPTVKLQKRTAGTNSLTLPFPVDQHGALRQLKKGGIASARRIKGDKKRLKNFLESLEILAEYAKNLTKDEIAARKIAKEKHVNASARIAQRQKQAAELKAQEYEKAATRVRNSAGLGKQPEPKDEGEK